jgi:hypothetical protein
MRSLHYTLKETGSGWEVWTPDLDGACIGSGPSKTQALKNAIDNCEGTIAALFTEWSKLLE